MSFSANWVFVENQQLARHSEVAIHVAHFYGGMSLIRTQQMGLGYGYTAYI